ncbi:MAG: DUF4956 domain-containing protein [Oscillospiraceae bacterium]|nr:DUF4956 domain-containing protein [Oscillospiraceae bacterium]
MFQSIYSAELTPVQFFAMAAAALLAGVVYSCVMSLSMHSTRRFFLVVSVIPVVVGSVLTFVNGNIGTGVAVGGAFSLIRFRSAQGSADEIAAILIAMGAGIAFGMGYLTYGAVILLGLSAVYYLLSRCAWFDRPAAGCDRMLLVTVPETLFYQEEFKDIFDRYLLRAENIGVKTSNMGSMFKLTYRIRMKEADQEKKMIDEIRTRNGNLEIAVLPYTEQNNQL